MKIKVITVIDHLGLGGAQQQLVEYLKNVDKKAFDISVINLDGSKDLVSHKIKALGIKIINLNHKGFFNFDTIKTLVNIFKEEKPDIVHTYLFTSDLYGRLSAKIAKVKFIICSVRNKNIDKKFHHLMADKILTLFTDAFYG